MSSPWVEAGTVYIGSDDGLLYALDAATGTPRWKVKTSGPIDSSPVVAGELVYVASYDGNLYAVTKSTGAVAWKFADPGERRFEARGIHGARPAAQMMPDPWDVYLSSPAVDHDTVYFGSGDGNLYAVDAATGALRWKFPTGDVVHDSPLVAGGVVYFGSWDSFLYAVDAKTGRERWRFKTGEDPQVHNQVGFQSSPALADGVLYVGCRDAHVYAVDASTGGKLWDHPTKGSWVVATPAVRDGVVYVGTSDSSLFEALDAKTGASRFVAHSGGLLFSSPAISGGVAYVGSFDGRLYALDGASGRVVWTFATAGAREDREHILAPDGSIALDRVFAAPAAYWEGSVEATGKMMTAGAILSSPALAGGVLYFGSADGSVYAVE